MTSLEKLKAAGATAYSDAEVDAEADALVELLSESESAMVPGRFVPGRLLVTLLEQREQDSSRAAMLRLLATQLRLWAIEAREGDDWSTQHVDPMREAAAAIEDHLAARPPAIIRAIEAAETDNGK